MMVDRPKVSVVMAVYNEQDFVGRAIESVLKQTFSDFEFIIVDDNSSDNTKEIVDRYKKSDNRIQLFANDSNMGLPASLNRGIKQAQGKYIARMDGDDISLPKRFEKQVDYLDSNPHVKVVGCHVELISIDCEPLELRRYNSGDRTAKEMKKNGPGIAHPSVMMRQSAVADVGFYRPSFTYAQDLDLWVRMAERFGTGFIDIIPEVLFQYRVTPEQFSRHSVNEIYASYAGEYLHNESELQSQLNDKTRVEDVSTENLDSRYWYTIGRYVLKQNRRKTATKYFLRSLRISPASIRGWYGLFLILLPSKFHRKLSNTLSSIIN